MNDSILKQQYIMYVERQKSVGANWLNFEQYKESMDIGGSPSG